MMKHLYASSAMLPKDYNSAECADTFRKMWKKDTIDEFESVYVIYLNSKNEMIFKKRLCEGNYSYTCFDTRRAVHYALHYKSPGFIIAHNHTHGTPRPSKNDIEITRSLIVALNELNIQLVDHIIITHDSYFSFYDEGLLDFKKKGSVKKTA